ncbi:MAG: protealysin inhibitor emfourin [Cyanobacteria bacterium P01_A01_bin.84]
MRIYLERTGGLVGNIKTRTVDTANIPENEVYTLEQLIEVADFFHIPHNVESSNLTSANYNDIPMQSYSNSDDTLVSAKSDDTLVSAKSDDTLVSAKSDRFQYELTVEDQDKQHTVVFSETSIPDTLRPLLDWLNNLSA